jgi:nitroimidazol reductase NimA-like FMN-containing flavoprotein (pyridoxamine 5'-phosphate oxidase superfamily)
MVEQTKRRKTPTAHRPHMPGYGIEEKPRGLLSWRWAEQRLSKTQNYFLATVRSDGRPHVMPIWGIWMEGRFYFSTGKTSVKTKNLATNPNCVLSAGTTDEAVILEGRASKIRDKETLKEFAATYLKKYRFDPSTMNEPVFVIRPKVAFGQIEKTFPKTATRWSF